MASQKELGSIYRETASDIKDIAMVKGINRLYDVFCGTLKITRYTDIDKTYCSDINHIKIGLMDAYQNEDAAGIKAITTKVINKNLTESIDDTRDTDMEQMIETLDSIYSELDTDDIMFSTLEETVEYNKKMHIERFSKNELVNKLNSKEIKFSCCDYREVEIQENSIVLCYAPYRKTDILQDKFSHKSYFNWLDNLADNNKNIVMLVLSYEHPGNKYEVYKVVEQEASNKKLKLYINSNAGLSEVNNVSCSDF